MCFQWFKPLLYLTILKLPAEIHRDAEPYTAKADSLSGN
jgi:hypothetical protein